MKNRTTTTRFPLIDQIRGFAIVLMVFFHFFYDLTAFRYVKINFQKDLFWWTLPRIIVFCFLLAMGLSLTQAHVKKIKWDKFLKRFSQLAIFAAIISISTYFLFPKRWIYFGTLHCIALTSLMALPLLKRPKIALLVSLTILVPAVFFKKNIPWIKLGHFSMDYIPPFPWIGVVCLGIFLWHQNFHHLKLPESKFLSFLEKLGRHSLKIYILHQPIMYTIIWAIYKIS